MNGDILFLQYQ